jgi:hypothetical protein
VRVSQTGRQAGRQADRQTDRQTDKQTGRQAGRQTDRQADRQAGRQAGSQRSSSVTGQGARLISSCTSFSRADGGRMILSEDSSRAGSRCFSAAKSDTLWHRYMSANSLFSMPNIPATLAIWRRTRRADRVLVHKDDQRIRFFFFFFLMRREALVANL